MVPIRGPGTAGNTGWALEIHDLLISKYVANREKDRHFTRAALRHGLADVERCGCAWPRPRWPTTCAPSSRHVSRQT